MPEPTLELLQTLILRSLEGQTAIHREVGDVRTVLLALVDQGRRTERRVEEIRDDIELMVKAELMGRIGNFETRIGAQLEALAERVSSLEVRTPDAT
jgi:hypothetical protein